VSSTLVRRALGAAMALAILSFVAIGPVLAHEQREVAGYDLVVGFIGEPVFTGQKSGLEFSVMKDEQPVTGLADTLQAEVIYGDQHRDLPLSPRFGQDGWYQSVFFPTAAGPYTFRIHGTINGQQIDASFTSGPDTFSEVEEATAGQFPVVLPATSELAAQAQRGAAAADQVTIALAFGVAGSVLALIGIGLGLAARRRSA
jgi:hypothetical protein